MNRILLSLDHAGNRRILSDCLGQRYTIIERSGENPYDGEFDLCIVDGQVLARTDSLLVKRKQSEPSIFLPALLVTSRQYASAAARRLWKSIDDVVFTPIEKVELVARVESLLRARRFSLELNLRREDLEAFIHGMAHDLRAPLRSISGFADCLMEDQGGRMDERGRHQLARLRSAAGDMWRLIDALVEFSRVGRKAIKLQAVDVKRMVENCLRDLEEVIQSSGARIRVQDDMGIVLGDPNLVRIALSNLISNALKYVAPGAQADVEICAEFAEHLVRIEVRDQGIGIAPEDQHRIFAPFVRLHGVEEYAGLGLGLSTARKVVDMMSGRMGVESGPGRGATFWIELQAGEA